MPLASSSTRDQLRASERHKVISCSVRVLQAVAVGP